MTETVDFKQKNLYVSYMYSYRYGKTTYAPSADEFGSCVVDVNDTPLRCYEEVKELSTWIKSEIENQFRGVDVLKVVILNWIPMEEETRELHVIDSEDPDDEKACDDLEDQRRYLDTNELYDTVLEWAISNKVLVKEAKLRNLVDVVDLYLQKKDIIN